MWIAHQDRVHHDVAVFIAQASAMVDGGYDVQFIHRRACDPQAIESLDGFEYTWEGKRRLHNLHQLFGGMMLLKRMKLPIQQISDTEVHMPVQFAIGEENIDEPVKSPGVIQAVFVEEAIEDAPVP